MRKRFLIKPVLQLKHLGWTLVIVIVCFASCYVLFESLVNQALSQGPIDAARWRQLMMTMRIGFGVALVVLLGAVGIENYLFFHSIAGPIYALERGLRRLADGDFRDITRIRETDQLREVVTAFQDMKANIVARIETQEKAARTLAFELDRIMAEASTKNVDQLLTRLKEIREKAEKLAA